MSANGSSGGGSNDSIALPGEVDISQDASSGSCMWYAGEDCVEPRSCLDCLAANMTDDQCAIGPIGECLSVNDLSAAERSASYEAANYTYCRDGDTVCTKCASRWTLEYRRKNEISAPVYCFGEDGCVCLAACELRVRDTRVVATYCATSGADAHELLGFFGIGVALCVLFALLGFGVRVWLHSMMHDYETQRRVRRESSRAARRQRSLPRRQPSGPALELSGWTAMLDKLIETEQAAEKRSERPRLAQPPSAVSGSAPSAVPGAPPPPSDPLV